MPTRTWWKATSTSRYASAASPIPATPAGCLVNFVRAWSPAAGISANRACRKTPEQLSAHRALVLAPRDEHAGRDVWNLEEVAAGPQKAADRLSVPVQPVMICNDPEPILQVGDRQSEGIGFIPDLFVREAAAARRDRPRAAGLARSGAYRSTRSTRRAAASQPEGAGVRRFSRRATGHHQFPGDGRGGAGRGRRGRRPGTGRFIDRLSGGHRVRRPRAGGHALTSRRLRFRGPGAAPPDWRRRSIHRTARAAAGLDVPQVSLKYSPFGQRRAATGSSSASSKGHSAAEISYSTPLTQPAAESSSSAG